MMKTLRYKTIIDAVEGFVKNTLAAQVIDDSDPDYGGFRCPDHLVCELWAAANTFTTMTILFFNPNSQYYRSQGLFQRMKLALQFITRSQNDDGTINIYFAGEMNTISNMAFIMQSLMKAYKLLSREVIEEESLILLESFLKKGVNAIKSVPIIPIIQQRAIASMLIDFDKLFFDHSALMKAEDYLSERIDINHDGLYSDKSPTYSMISNAMLINVAKKLNKVYLIEYVRRNLNFQLYNFYSGSEVVTEYSLSPDLESGMPQGYAVWKEMSIIDHNGYYASASDLVLDAFLANMRGGYVDYYVKEPDFTWRNHSRFLATSGIGELLLVEDEFNNDAVNRLSLPNNYEKVFSNSNIARVKNGKMSFTIMANNSNLFAFHNGQTVIDSFRIKYNYDSYRTFFPKKLEVATRSYILRDWYARTRPETEQGKAEPAEADLKMLAEFTYKKDSLDIDVSATGQRGIPLQLEFGIRRHGVIIANGREYGLNTTDLISMDAGEAIIKAGDDCITIRGGSIQHNIHSYDVANLHTTSLMITPLTPFYDRIQITWS